MISELQGSASAMPWDGIAFRYSREDRALNRRGFHPRRCDSHQLNAALAADARFPQGLKPTSIWFADGTTKVVPFHKSFGTTKAVPFQTIPLQIFSTPSHA
jgi:hypothetical protein